MISRKFVGALVSVAIISASTTAVAASPKAGASCAGAGKVVVVGSNKLTCVKVGKKLVWKATKSSTASVPAPLPTPTKVDEATPEPSPSQTPSPTPEPSATFSPLKPSASAAEAWSRSGWQKPTGSEAVSAAATAAFNAYVGTIRNPGAKVTIWAEAGSDQTLVGWVTKASALIATTFETPYAIDNFNDVIAVTRGYLVDTFTRLYDAGYANAQAGAWDNGSPAWGGRVSNGWSMGNITKNNSMVNDRSGMAQTAGHEYFHAIQENFVNNSGTNCGPCGTPQWFWEGPAMFVGLESAANLGFINYATDGRAVMLNRVHRQPTGKLALADVSVNTPPSIDPYGIGEIATEFLVANVGMAKFVDVYRQVGKGASFPIAFEKATGVPLADFYLMFEDARAELGIPKE